MPSRRSLLAGGTAAALTAPLLTAGPAAAGPKRRHHRLVTGAESAAADDFSLLRGRRVGVLSNPTGVLRDTSHVVDTMAANDTLDIVGVFGPEHGFRGTAQAGDSEGKYTDPRTGLTVYDAYGADAAKMKELFTTPASTPSSSTSRTSAPASTPTSGRCTTRCGRRPRIGARFVVLDRPEPDRRTRRRPDDDARTTPPASV